MNRSDRFLCTWPDCGKTYGKASKLTEHVRSHTNTRPFQCTVCEKTFLRNGHLRRHQATAHTADPKPFSCSHVGCTKSFSLKHHLRRHGRTHEETRPFQCPESGCEAGFTRKEQLKKHMMTLHSEPVGKSPKVYACGWDDCTQAFTKWSLLLKHRKGDHQTSIGIRCGECEKGFAKPRYLKLHVGRVHARLQVGTLFRCEWEGCGKSFSSKNAVKVHKATVHEKIKAYACERCGKNFGHKHLVVRHRRTHDKTKVVPEERMIKSYSLVDRLVGTDLEEQRPFICPVLPCTQRFIREFDLKRHLDAFHAIDLPDFIMQEPMSAIV